MRAPVRIAGSLIALTSFACITGTDGGDAATSSTTSTSTMAATSASGSSSTTAAGSSSGAASSTTTTSSLSTSAASGAVSSVATASTESSSSASAPAAAAASAAATEASTSSSATTSSAAASTAATTHGSSSSAATTAATTSSSGGGSFTVVSGCDEGDYVDLGAAASVVTAGNSYTPKCVAVSPGASVTIDASAIHPLQGMADVDGVSNPFRQASGATTPQTETLGTPGFYGFYCVEHGGPTGTGMAGTIWVQ